MSYKENKSKVRKKGLLLSQPVDAFEIVEVSAISTFFANGFSSSFLVSKSALLLFMLTTFDPQPS
jgi:hypothetical protein